jgi:flavin reductase (DIM6/NTAB) family NADH-FMN oxidoreductase RutF
VSGGLAEQFRAVMAGVPTPVSVVTTLTDGQPHGTTVSAFASLSMTPPMVLVSLGRGSELLSRLAEGSVLGVNVLGSHQAPLALAFARKGAGGFAGVGWAPEEGAPRLTGSPGWLACTVSRLVDGGDHVVVLAEVRAAATDGGPPLTYHARTFGTHAAAS